MHYMKMILLLKIKYWKQLFYRNSNSDYGYKDVTFNITQVIMEEKIAEKCIGKIIKQFYILVAA